MSVRFQALLTRVAKTDQGAVELLRCGLVGQLIDCQVFDMLPDSDAHRYGDQCERKTYGRNYYYSILILIQCVWIFGWFILLPFDISTNVMVFCG